MVHTRTLARQLALQALCVFDAVGADFELRLSEFLRDPENHTDLDVATVPVDEEIGFAAALARGTWIGRERYDELLRASLTDWSLSRVSPVDRNILRMTLHEWLEPPNTGFAIVINEAVELAKRFGGADSPRFVNGVLDGVRRQVEKSQA